MDIADLIVDIEKAIVKEVKNILWLLLLVLPVFGLCIYGWLHSPMYERTLAEQQGMLYLPGYNSSINETWSYNPILGWSK